MIVILEEIVSEDKGNNALQSRSKQQDLLLTHGLPGGEDELVFLLFVSSILMLTSINIIINYWLSEVGMMNPLMVSGSQPSSHDLQSNKPKMAYSRDAFNRDERETVERETKES